MEPRDFLPYRTPLVGALVALTVGVTGGLALRTGSQIGPEAEPGAPRDSPYTPAAPIAWPGGKVPDYVIGTDFLQAQRMDQPPVVVAAYEVPEYLPAAEREPEPEVQAEPARPSEAERDWPSTGGDILDTRLPEDLLDAPVAPEAPRAPEAPVAAPAPAVLVRLY
ncbi:hypothetical protein ASD79_16220 [Caulobacter sp. Root655]|uniref:hypothetical protein n=1 Tax=Caulobacter sp. Root655 TaxID=1736578 RepID=UPI0006F3088F|nr:hypothetical protein [Caulobacter sp. Root655]KRA57856.1 hypothetical protein ASD79_16220 [Caulobacter sp. Root655]